MVTTSPVPFNALPRQDGDWPAETPAAQAPFATAIDNNFAAINPPLGPWENQFKVEHVKPVFALNTSLVKFYSANNYVDGLIIGDLRVLMIVVSWESGAVSADDYGGIPDQKLGQVTDSRFWPGKKRQLWFVGDYQCAMCTFYLNYDGSLWLAGLSGPDQWVDLNDFIALNAIYLVDGS